MIVSSQGVRNSHKPFVRGKKAQHGPSAAVRYHHGRLIDKRIDLLLWFVPKRLTMFRHVLASAYLAQHWLSDDALSNQAIDLFYQVIKNKSSSHSEKDHRTVPR